MEIRAHANSPEPSAKGTDTAPLGREAASGECILKIEHLRKEYPGVTPLKDINTEIYRGDIISLIGPSGTGKSTLLRCINRLEKPTSGRILFMGQEMTDDITALSAIRQKMGMVFQSFYLFDNLTVLENVCAAPIDLKKIPRAQAEQRARELIRRVGLSNKADCYPSELSGGQRQRIAIARAMAMDPEILLLDEPTSALDPKMVQEVQFLIERLARTGITILIVTHEMDFARQISSRIFYMDEGVIYEEGSPEVIFDHPVREKTRQFVERFRKFELDIDLNNLDMDDILIRLEYFVRNNRLSEDFITRLHDFVKGIVVTNLLKKQPQPQLQTAEILLEAIGDGAVEIRIQYPGPCYDPMQHADPDFSSRIAQESDYQHSYQRDENIIRAKLAPGDGPHFEHPL